MSAELQQHESPGARASTHRRSALGTPAFREDADGRAVPVEGTTTLRTSSTGRLERSLRRAIEHRPADGLTSVGLLVGPGLPDRYAPSVTRAVNVLIAIAASCAAARRVDVVVGLSGDELVVCVQHDGAQPGEDPALDPHAARLWSLRRQVEECGGGVQVRRDGGRTVTRLGVPVG